MYFGRDVHVGSPPANHPFEDRVTVHFHNFEGLRQRKGKRVKSSSFLCAGYEWSLLLYPRGHNYAEDGMISVYLRANGSSNIEVDFDIILKTKSGENCKMKSILRTEFPMPDDRGCGWKDYIEREWITNPSNNILNNGTLTFEVRIRPRSNYYCNVNPRASVGDNLLKLFIDENGVINEESADVSFEVENQVLYAHKIILKAQEPDLAELVESYNRSKPLPINDIKAEAFRPMIKFLYGVNIQPSEWKEYGKQILDASGKYGFATLKSEAEAWYLKNLTLTVENVIDELLYADGHDCSLIKRASMDFIVDHGEDVMEADSYDRLDESPQLRREVMKAAFSSRKRNREE
jgi:hypothetical protein